MALGNLLTHPIINTIINLGGEGAENAAEVLAKSVLILDRYVESKWPHKENK